MSQSMQGHPRAQVIVKSSDKMWSTREGNGNSFQYSCLENLMDSMKRQKDITSEEEPSLRLEGIQYATGEEQRAITKSPSKNEAAEPKQKQLSVLDVSVVESKVQ